jgi:hypothetical protein
MERSDIRDSTILLLAFPEFRFAQSGLGLLIQSTLISKAMPRL